MDALFLPFLAALLAGLGDKSQRLAMLLADRFGRSAPVFAGVALAALVNSVLAAAAGLALRATLSAGGQVNFPAVSLLLALALLFAGLGALRQKAPEAPARGGAFPASLFAAFVLGFGESGQFLTLALAARAGSAALPAIGATLGMLAVAAPAVAMGSDLARALPLRAIRLGAGVLFLLAGFAAAVSALGLA